MVHKIMINAFHMNTLPNTIFIYTRPEVSVVAKYGAFVQRLEFRAYHFLNF